MQCYYKGLPNNPQIERKSLLDQKDEPPYKVSMRVVVEKNYNPNYGDDRLCECGHPYYRHFDTYDNMANVGCKYCGCFNFVEDVNDKS